MLDALPQRNRPLLWSCCLFLIFGTGLRAQPADSFYPGSILLEDGTERAGEIYYDDWIRTPDSIRFRESAAATARYYGPRDLAGFAVAESQYRTETVTLSPDIADLSGEKPRLRFLREEVLGKVNLYSHVAAEDKLHLFVDTGTGPVELVNRRYRSEKAGYGYQVVTDEKFRGQLKYVLRDCPRVAQRADDVLYTRYAIVNLVRGYHDCIDAAATVLYRRSRSDRQFALMPIVGLASTHLSYRSDLRRFQGADFPAETNVSIGLGVEGKILKRWWPVVVYVEMHYQRSDLQVEYPIEGLGMVTVRQSARFAQLRNNIGMRANVLPNSNRLFISAGVSNVFFLGRDLLQEANFPAIEDQRPFLSRGSAIGFHTDLGARIGRLRLMLRYDLDEGFSATQSVSTPLRYYRFLLGYSL